MYHAVDCWSDSRVHDKFGLYFCSNLFIFLYMGIMQCDCWNDEMVFSRSVWELLFLLIEVGFILGHLVTDCWSDKSVAFFNFVHFCTEFFFVRLLE